MARFGKPSVSQIIQKVVANDPATTELDFSGNSIYQMKSSEKTRELCDALVGSKHVTRVILQNCEIGDGEAALIGEMLAKNQSIEELILKENKPLKDVRARARLSSRRALLSPFSADPARLVRARAGGRDRDRQGTRWQYDRDAD